MKQFLNISAQHPRNILFLLLFTGFAYYASYETHRITARYATEWMNMYSFRDYKDWQELREYIILLRTGIPPVLSISEIFSYNLIGNADWIVKGLYRKALIAMLIFPVLFSSRSWLSYIYCFISALILLEAILIIHYANPQLYDVLLPFFLMASLLLSRISFKDHSKKIYGILAALGAGFLLSMAELSRPFMIAFVPILIAYNIYQLHHHKLLKRLFWFLLPIILCSGLWHLKLYTYNHQQLIWSNHSGTNLFRAWVDFVDQDQLLKELEEEAPPEREGRWMNINTQIHTRNSDRRKTYVWAGIKKEPGKAIAHLWDKTLVFTAPRTDMYGYDPQQKIVKVYKIMIRGLFILLPIISILFLLKLIRKKMPFFDEKIMVLGLTLFLTLMPIIGEAGEEARFVVAVVPFLVVIGGYTIDEIEQLKWPFAKKEKESISND